MVIRKKLIIFKILFISSLISWHGTPQIPTLCVPLVHVCQLRVLNVPQCQCLVPWTRQHMGPKTAHALHETKSDNCTYTTWNKVRQLHMHYMKQSQTTAHALHETKSDNCTYTTWNKVRQLHMQYMKQSQTTAHTLHETKSDNCTYTT